MGEIRCPSCGWENEAGARICGGCGRSLRPSAAAAFEPRGPYSAHGLSAGGQAAYGGATDPDMPTVRDYPVYSPPHSPRQRHSPPPAPRSAQWTGAARLPTQRGFGGVGRIALVVIALLGLLCVGVWSAAARPRLHQRVDSLLRAQMLSMVATVNRVPTIPSATVSVSGDQASANLQAGIPSDVPLQNVQVAFQGGRTVVSFITYGLRGTVTTQLTATDGRLTAADTTVNGPVGLVESGDELQDALNASLANLRHDVSIQQVTQQNDILAVSVKGNT